MFTLSYAHGVTPQFLHQVKGFIEIYIRDKFHLYTICCSQVINVQMIWWWCSTQEMDHFGGFLGPFSPKYGWILVKVWPEVVYKKKKTEYGQSFKIIFLRGNGTYPKFTVLVHFLDQFIPGKQKILPENKNFPRKCILRNIKLNQSQFPDKSHNSYKSYLEKPFFGPKMGTDCRPGAGPKGQNKFSHT